MKTDGSKSIKNGAGHAWVGSVGLGCTPPKSRVPLLPKYMNKSLWWRIKEWFYG